MNPERWQRLKELFSTVSELGLAERAAYLDRACSDADLRAELDSLLHAGEAPGAVIDQPAFRYLAGTDAPAAEEPLVGTRIGPYELTALIGRGGMGEVYRARRADEQYEHEVAVKLVRAGYDVGYVLQRFRAERQILANLDHPNIARLLDGGATDRGMPYLVMELVAGEPIDSYCEKRNLSLGARLRLFSDVCSAVSYAHQHLVVHRDLKPSNILVTEDGTVKLLDFGVAKLLQPAIPEASADPTLTVMHAFTPAFASPEQVLGLTITTASDIYSLGVVLYHLIAGRSPYERKVLTTQDAIREVCELQPARPSTRIAGAGAPTRIDHDLDAIALKALRKEPAGRYASAAALAEDVGRFLSGQPVAARGTHRGYVLRKFLRRYRWEAASLLLVLVALAAAAAVAISQAHQARQAQAQAEHNLQRARSLSESLLFDIHDAIADVPGSIAARKLLVARAVSNLDDMARDAADDAALRRDLASAYERLGEIQGGPFTANGGDTAAAEASLRKAIDLLDRQQPDSARTPADTVALAKALSVHADTLVTANSKPEVARSELQRAVALCEAALVHAPSNPALLEELVSNYSDLAGALGSNWNSATMGFLPQALELHEKQLAVAQRLAALDPANPSSLRRVMVAQIQIGDTMMQSGRIHDAKRQFELAREPLQQLLRSGRTRQVAEEEISEDQRLGWVQFWEGDSAAALATQRNAYAAAQQLVSQDANDAHALEMLAIQAANVADGESQLARYSQARRSVGEAFALLEKLMKRDQTNAEYQTVDGQAQYIAGMLEYRASRAPVAMKYFSAARDQFSALASANASNADARHYQAAALASLGYAAMSAGDATTARKHFDAARRLLEGRREAEVNESVRYTLADSYFGLALSARTDRVKSCDWYGRGMKAWAQIPEAGATSPDGFYVLGKTFLRRQPLDCPQPTAH
jgi:eukaryotic-like serine/threonine-protein kinase